MAGDRYKPRSRLVSVEQTTNLAGGRLWPLEQLREVLEVAARHRLRTHLDGARLLNAVVASGVAAADWARGFDHHVDRLAEDHANARILADELAELPGITLDPTTVETNIVVFRLAGASRFCERLETEHGVRMGALGPDLVRAVTHHDVDTADVYRATRAIDETLRGAR